jgi:hypothetical protein
MSSSELPESPISDPDKGDDLMQELMGIEIGVCHAALGKMQESIERVLSVGMDSRFTADHSTSAGGDGSIRRQVLITMQKEHKGSPGYWVIVNDESHELDGSSTVKIWETIYMSDPVRVAFEFKQPAIDEDSGDAEEDCEEYDSSESYLYMNGIPQRLELFRPIHVLNLTEQAKWLTDVLDELSPSTLND